MSLLPERLVLATRGSELALNQAGYVADILRATHARLQVDIQTVSTKGDRDKRPFAQIGGKGLFTSEVEREVAEGRADAAVHSAKDLTAALAPGCHIVCIPGRGSAEDVVVGGTGDTGEERLASLREGARVGTSSMRRRALLAEVRPDVEAVEFRGNIDTRLRKVADGRVDAAILAAAGIERLGAAAAGVKLDPSTWIPAPGQGALAVEALAHRRDLVALFEPLNDPSARAEVICERSFAVVLEGGCTVPLGCLARVEGDRMVVAGYLSGPDGTDALRDRISGSPAEAESLGAELAQAILASGGKEILEELRAIDAPEVVEP